VHGSNVLEAVDKYLKEHDSDWLMVFPEKHGLLEFHTSRSKALILHCPVPVMSICEKVVAERTEEAKTKAGKVAGEKSVAINIFFMLAN
jgi:hypothetical protein